MPDELSRDAQQHFSALVESVGIKRFADAIGLSTRQVNRILSGAQPNPVERLLRSVQAAEPKVGDDVIDYICQEMGGTFVREEALDHAMVNAVKECAEAIAAISDGKLDDADMREVREAISALQSVVRARRRPR